MTDILTPILKALLQPLLLLLYPREPLSVYYLAGAFVFAAAIYLAWRRHRRPSARGLLAFALPRRIFGHPSAKLDYRFFVVNAVFAPFLFGLMIVAGAFWSGIAVNGLAWAFGPGAAGTAGTGASWAIMAAATLAVFMAVEFGYWLAHWLLHRVPLLWEIHKVHHSAEVLTPATAGRVHPLEDILISNIVSVAVGAVYGGFIYAFGSGAVDFKLWEVNVLFLVFYFTTYHLRHSHVWLTVPGPLAYIIHSPAHHQIHHSTDPRHLNKNLGFALVFWDWVFGTLWVPARKQALQFGIGAEGKEFNSVARLFYLPFVKGARLLAPRPAAAATPATADAGALSADGLAAPSAAPR